MQTILFVSNVIKTDIRNDMENHFKRKLDVWNGLLECNLASNLPLYIPISQGSRSSVGMMRYGGEVVFSHFCIIKDSCLWIMDLIDNDTTLDPIDNTSSSPASTADSSS